MTEGERIDLMSCVMWEILELTKADESKSLCQSFLPGFKGIRIMLLPAMAGPVAQAALKDVRCADLILQNNGDVYVMCHLDASNVSGVRDGVGMRRDDDQTESEFHKEIATIIKEWLVNSVQPVLPTYH